jgi:hypothetical protein
MALVTKNFSDIITFTRASTATFFNSAGVLTSAATNAPRLDYNPSTLAAQGLLIEESRTNSIRNNTMVGAVAGTPGTLPTNWATASLGTLTQQVVGTGTSNGITYIDIRLSGTTSTTQFSLRLEPNGTAAIPAVNGQTWTGSAWLALVGGSTTNISQVGQSGLLWDAGGAFLGGGYAGPLSPSSITANLTRFTASGTNAIVGTAFIQPQIYFVFASGVAIDITLRIGLPQLELGSFATSVIPTTTTALTRAADVASVNTLSPWYNASAGSFYVEATVAPGLSAFPNTIAVNDGTVNNRIISYLFTNGFYSSITTGGASQGTGGLVTPPTVGAASKFAFAYATNRLQGAANGAAGTEDTTVTLPSGLNIMRIGAVSATTNFYNSHIQRITYYPRSLSQAELISITT